MTHSILTTGSASFFGVLLAFYLYFAPAILAFVRAHPRFWIILALNVIAPPVQIALFEMSGVFPHPGMEDLALAGLALLVVLGPVWLGLMLWAAAPVLAPDARLLAWRETKTYDMAAALPLIAWFLNCAMAMRADITFLGRMVVDGEADGLMLLQFASLVLSALFFLSCVWALLMRERPVLRAHGVLSRLAAVAGTFLGATMLRLPVPDMTLARQALVFLLVALGSLGSLAALWRLGKSFSILPEARQLVTDGPYAHIRHPLYAAQIVGVCGLILQYEQPWALLIGAAVIALQVIRSVYEEQVLTQAFPEYDAYRARTRRFIPGLL